ncbi:MAG TPA: DNA repair protein RecN [Planctomycetales bacterium]|jgi:DNA repair protein RecN (Recombination protein N)|nr:DNA repair protein RecN [Planctomycetales bacterium]
MLRELSVQNLALIEDVRVELQPGFCVWTGETGAGKSLLLGALGLLLGDRGSADLLRTGADELRITGRFELESLELRREVEAVLNAPLEENEVILSRRLTRAGRSHAYVNDQPAAVSTLKQVGELLVDVHGQRESESLLHPAYQMQLLDAFGNLETPRKSYLKQAEKVRELRRRYTALSAARQQRQRELALVRFEREEIDEAALEPGEIAEKTRERERLANAQNLQTFAAQAASQLYDDDGSVVERLGRLQREAQTWAALDPGLEEVVRRLEEMQAEVQDATRTLRKLAQQWEANPERLEEVEQRLQFLRRMETKYRRSVDDLVVYRVSLDEQETRLQKDEDDLSGIQAGLTEEYAKLKATAADLSKQRRKIAKRLASETQKQFADLGMAEARLDAVLEPLPWGGDPTTADIHAWGAEQLELTLAANPGEPARPLRKVASGGELSRTMLALKTVLSGHDRLGTLVFDEIDANVGGRLGDILGQKLAALGRTHQVVCVTHLPQVASYARWHWTIRKARRGNRTLTQIQTLKEEDRLEELASMLRGASRGETTRQEAAAMLEAARLSW